MQDRRGSPLFELSGGMSFCLCNLLLTGCATPHLQNGSVTNTQYISLAVKSHSFSVWRQAVWDPGEASSWTSHLGVLGRFRFSLRMLTRSSYAGAADKPAVRQSGSWLKSPILPIWVTKHSMGSRIAFLFFGQVTCVNDNWGVLFNPNIDVLKSANNEK